MPTRLEVAGLALGILDRVLLGKALPSILTETGFLRELLKEVNALRRVIRGDVDSLMGRVRVSTNINWPESTPSQRARVIRELGNLIKGMPSDFLPGVSVVLDERGTAVVQDTRTATRQKHRKLTVSPNLSQVDREGVAALRETTSLFFAPEYERQAARFTERARKRLADGLERGAGRVEIARDLREEFAASAIHDRYWQTVAAVHTNRARSFSSASSYLDAGVTRYEVQAVLDERTTPICEFMDGKIFEVGRAIDQFQAFEAADNLDQIKDQIMPFMRVKGNDIVLPSGSRVAEITADRGFARPMSDKSLNEEGIHMPPYHFGCRTTVIPVL